MVSPEEKPQPRFLAHSASKSNHVDSLADHLGEVAELAEAFAAPLGLAAQARLAGLLPWSAYQRAFKVVPWTLFGITLPEQVLALPAGTVRAKELDSWLSCLEAANPPAPLCCPCNIARLYD
jgi:hypothetical protein